jgi:hypothetical protein
MQILIRAVCFCCHKFLLHHWPSRHHNKVSNYFIIIYALKHIIFVVVSSAEKMRLYFEHAKLRKKRVQSVKNHVQLMDLTLHYK